MLTVEQLKDLIKMCRGEKMPGTIEETIAVGSYAYRLQGCSMKEILCTPDPCIDDMNKLQLVYFLLGITLAEDDILELDIEFIMELDEKDKITH